MKDKHKNTTLLIYGQTVSQKFDLKCCHHHQYTYTHIYIEKEVCHQNRCCFWSIVQLVVELKVIAKPHPGKRSQKLVLKPETAYAEMNYFSYIK